MICYHNKVKPKMTLVKEFDGFNGRKYYIFRTKNCCTSCGVVVKWD